MALWSSDKTYSGERSVIPHKWRGPWPLGNTGDRTLRRRKKRSAALTQPFRSRLNVKDPFDTKGSDPYHLRDR